MIKFIIKLFKFIFTLFISFIIFIFVFSFKMNMSFENTYIYLKSIGTELLNINDYENISTNNNIIDNTSPITTATNNNYYGQQLDDTAKIIYSSFEKNIYNLKKENFVIDFSTTFNDLLNKTTGQYTLNKSFQSALDAFFYDHPEIFYIDLNKISLNTQCMTIGPSRIYTVTIT